MTLEQLAKKIFAECEKDGEPVTMEEAIEMAKMELGSKEIKNYVQSTVEKKRGAREVKLDATKVGVIEELADLMQMEMQLSDVVIINPQKEITFTIDDDNYSVTLTKHKKKNKKSIDK